MFVMDITKYKVLMSKALCLRNLDRMFLSDAGVGELPHELCGAPDP